MDILESVYRNICINTLKTSSESGGILGGKNHIVTNFVFDRGLPQSDIGHYFPNTSLLNQHLNTWASQEIEFYGIIHSHYTKVFALSAYDKIYIEKIMCSMPQDINHLYFPIIYPNGKIISFKAIRFKGQVTIIDDLINILKECEG